MGRRMLPRLLSRWNVAPRRAAEQLVFDGRVAVDGRVVRDVLREVDEDLARITVDGQPVGPRAEPPTWWLLHKPVGVVTTTRDPEGRRTVLDLVAAAGPVPAGLAPVGRLDRDSSGALLLTNEHALAAALLDPQTHVEKRYVVTVRGAPSPDVLARIATTAVEVDGLVLGPMVCADVAEAPGGRRLEVRLSEGKNRQIRRRLAAEGHPVASLHRVDFGPVTLGELPAGAFRGLDAAEIAALRTATYRP